MSEHKLSSQERKLRFSEVSENTAMDVFKSSFRIIYKNKRAFIGLIILVFFVALAIFGPMLVKPELLKQNLRGRLQMPSIEHPLGTDNKGKDTLAQFVYGAQNVLTVAAIAAVFTLAIACVVGMTAGLLGGKTDTVLMFVTNLILTVPSLPIMMLLSMVVEIKDPITFGFVLSIWSWAGLARNIRSQILTIKRRDYVEAARILGMSNWHIISKELLPSVTSYLATNLIFTLRSAISASVNLMFLGLVPFSSSHWGMMIQLAISTTGALFGSAPAMIYFLVPVVGIALFGMGCFFFASGLDEALNPRLRTQ